MSIVDATIKTIKADLTIPEQDELAWALIKHWPGPQLIPGTKGLAMFPLHGMVKPGDTGNIAVYCNLPFKPVRLVIQNATWERKEYIPELYTPPHLVLIPGAKWWHPKRSELIKGRVIRAASWKSHIEDLPRHHWTVHVIYVSDTSVYFGPHPVNGDAFAPDATCDYEFPMAHRGHQISIVVSHDRPSPVLFRAVLLGRATKERGETE